MAFFETDAIILDLQRRLEKEKSLRRRILLESSIKSLQDYDRLLREN
ncbi:MAG: hypothetical protein Q7R47_05970 [Candidatus Diapherotrites archaeon]|nr:hypothetical protein [Candidatus Diapherotrites archaeon]